VSRVQLVVSDQLASSLGGHIDLSRPLPADMTLIALEPSPAPSGTPAAASTSVPQ
jgi:hypothetical protein